MTMHGPSHKILVQAPAQGLIVSLGLCPCSQGSIKRPASGHAAWLRFQCLGSGKPRLLQNTERSPQTLTGRLFPSHGHPWRRFMRGCMTWNSMLLGKDLCIESVPMLSFRNGGLHAKATRRHTRTCSGANNLPWSLLR